MMPFFLALRAAIFGLLGKSSPYKSEVRFFIGAKLFWAEMGGFVPCCALENQAVFVRTLLLITIT